MKHKKEKWMTNNLLSLVNQKNLMYRDWKLTINVKEYTVFKEKKLTFKLLRKL